MVSQKTDVSTKIFQLNADFFGNFMCKNFSFRLKKSEFPCAYKHADVVPVHKNNKK